MRPIRQGDGTGLSASGVSEVRTGDGTVLWSAGGDIPDSVVAQFNAQNLSGFADGDVVSTWPEEVAGNDATGDATYRESGINGHPALAFDGLDDAFNAPIGTISQPVTIFAVGNLDDTAAGQAIVDGGVDGNMNRIYWDDKQDNWRATAGVFDGATEGSADTTIQLFTAVFDDSGGSVFRENGTQTQSGDFGSETLEDLSIGVADTGSDLFWDGDIGFVEIHAGTPSNGLQTREQEIADMWGISIPDNGTTDSKLTELLMDEGSGTTLADTGTAGNDGTITGATWTSDSDAAGGYVLFLDGDSDDITVPNISEYDTDEFTAALWVNTDSLPSDDAQVFGQYQTGGDNRSWRIAFDADQDDIPTSNLYTLDWSTDGTSGTVDNNPSVRPPDTGDYVCFVARWNGDELTMFQSEVPVGMKPVDNIYNGNADIVIGNGNDFTQPLAADVDRFVYWPEALSRGGIKQHIQSTDIRSSIPTVNQPHDPGAFIWYGGPFGVHKSGVTVTGWVQPGGNIRVASYDHGTGEWSFNVLENDAYYDDHTNPSFLIRESDNHIIAFYGRHGQTATGLPTYYISDSPLDISSWSGPFTFDIEFTDSYSYPKPVQFSDGTIHQYYRTKSSSSASGNNVENFVVSTDGGDTFGAENTLIEWQDTSQWCYSTVTKDPASDTVHIGTNPKDGGYGAQPYSIYYLQYDHPNDTYQQADGTQIGTDSDRPFGKTDLELVYDESASGNHPAWIWDSAVDDAGNPYLAFVTFPNFGTSNPGNDSNYKWAQWTGSSWNVQTVVSGSGPSLLPDQQPLYTGGISLNQNDPTEVFIGQEINGQFEIQTASTSDGGSTWSFTDVTSNSFTRNFRPMPIKDAASELRFIWMNGYYRNPNKDYNTVVKSNLDGQL